jgi:copper chaperone NosL
MNRFFQIAVMLILLFSPATLIAAQKGENTPSATDKCPVCGMFVSKYPNWTAIAKTRDGRNFYYDGPKDMFSHYFDTGRYTTGKRQSDISGLLVKEYYSLKMIDAKSAFFVSGSDVYGPMGGELIPFATQKDASSFMKDHHGKKLLRFNEVTLQLIKLL